MTEPQRPTNDDDREGWKAYWTAQGMPWRTESEIDEQRQRYLAGRRAIVPDFRVSTYPFRDIELKRGDIEWLLATHDSGGMPGPVSWEEEKGKTPEERRKGLDLRGAILRSINLSELPLACTVAGLSLDDYRMVTSMPSTNSEAVRIYFMAIAAVRLIDVSAFSIDLRNAELMGARFENVQFFDAHLERAILAWAELHHVLLMSAHFEGADLNQATLQEVAAQNAHFEGAELSGVRTTQANFLSVHFDGANCTEAHLEGALLEGAAFHGTKLRGARLEGALLKGAHFEGKELSDAEVQWLRQWKTDYPSVLPAADLREAVLDKESSLTASVMGNEKFGALLLVDARLTDTNLATADWTYSKSRFLGRWTESFTLGDEREARKLTNPDGQPKTTDEWLMGYKDAVRANRQLATALRSQGLNEDADRYAYNAQKLQREVLRRQGRYGPLFGSWVLHTISGYGYRPFRSLLTYILVVVGFAAIYFVLRDSVHPALNPLDAVIFSITSFHGRGFSPGEAVTLHNPLTIFAAIEAIIGLLIEITFIATFTQRFFSR